jgi:hypothetical protein
MRMRCLDRVNGRHREGHRPGLQKNWVQVPGRPLGYAQERMCIMAKDLSWVEEEVRSRVMDRLLQDSMTSSWEQFWQSWVEDDVSEKSVEVKTEVKRQWESVSVLARCVEEVLQGVLVTPFELLNWVKSEYELYRERTEV